MKRQQKQQIPKWKKKNPKNATIKPPKTQQQVTQCKRKNKNMKEKKTQRQITKRRRMKMQQQKTQNKTQQQMKKLERKTKNATEKPKPDSELPSARENQKLQSKFRNMIQK